MKECSLYDFDSSELFECISDTKVTLKNNNMEYRNIFYKIERIKNKYPNIREILEDQKAHKLSFPECEALVKVVDLFYDLLKFEEYEIFLLGGRECCNYFSRMGVL